jgi:hypothetical protein
MGSRQCGRKDPLRKGQSRLAGVGGSREGHRRMLMLNTILLISVMSCQSSPVDPSRDIQSGGSQVSPDGVWVDVDLESFETTDELRADRKVFPIENLNLDKVYLDRTVAYTPGGLTRSMRYDWTDQGTKSISIGRGIRLAEPVDELWAEVVIRFSSNFTTCNPAELPCDHKTFFLQVTPDGNGRWEAKFGACGSGGPRAPIHVGSPKGHDFKRDQPELERCMVDAFQYFDERWHVVRIHAKHSTDVETPDAELDFWVDGQLLGSYRGEFSTNTGTKINGILLGRNKDKGRDEGTESMWIGRVRAWRVDPSW